jgi:hypothetical protein
MLLKISIVNNKEELCHFWQKNKELDEQNQTFLILVSVCISGIKSIGFVLGNHLQGWKYISRSGINYI